MIPIRIHRLSKYPMVTLICALLTLPPTLPGIQFHSRPGTVYVPAREAAKLLGWELRHDAVLDLTWINGKAIPVDQPKLFSGTLLLEQRDLPTGKVQVKVGKPRVAVDLSKQTISAWQGPVVVMHSPISSGRNLKDTPPGSYQSGFKKEMHVSTIYGSKMPFSVHLRGNYFIHGSEQTQAGPGSHGCIRLPMYNHAAKWFYDWVSPGTEVKVHGKRPVTRTK